MIVMRIFMNNQKISQILLGLRLRRLQVPLRNGAFVEGAWGGARAALLIGNYSYAALVCLCCDLRQPKLVLCTSLIHCSPCSGAGGGGAACARADGGAASALSPTVYAGEGGGCGGGARGGGGGSSGGRGGKGHPGVSTPRIPTHSTVQGPTRAFQRDSTTDIRSLCIYLAFCRSTAAE